MWMWMCCHRLMLHAGNDGKERVGDRCYGGVATVRLMDLSTLMFTDRVCNRAPGWCHRVGFADQLPGPDGRI